MLEKLSYISDIVVALITLIGAIAAINKYYSERRREKRKTTIDAYSELQKEVFDKLYVDFTRSEIEEIAKNYKINADKYHLLGTYMAKIEHFCVGVMNDTYDWKTTYELAHGFFDGTLNKWLSPMLDRKKSFNSTYDPYGHTKQVMKKLEDYAVKIGEKNLEEK